MVIDVVHGKRAPRFCCYWKCYTVFFNGIPRLNYGYKNSLRFLLVDNQKAGALWVWSLGSTSTLDLKLL